MSIKEFRVSLRISAPIQEVWNELVTWKNQGNWMALTKVTSSHFGPKDSGVGTTIEAFTGIGKFGIIDEMKVIDWQPPTNLTSKSVGAAISKPSWMDHTGS